jgi:hypothetical protein
MILNQNNGRQHALPREVGRSIVATCRDGKWRSAAQIARRAGTAAISEQISLWITSYPNS